MLSVWQETKGLDVMLSVMLLKSRERSDLRNLICRWQALEGTPVDCSASYQLATGFRCGSLSPRWAHLTAKLSNDHAWTGLLFPLFQPRYSFVCFKIMALHFLQHGESQGEHPGLAEDGCHLPNALTWEVLWTSVSPQTSAPPASHCPAPYSESHSHLDTQGVLERQMAAEVRPDAQTSLLGNLGIWCPKQIDSFVLISGATKGILWVALPGIPPN